MNGKSASYDGRKLKKEGQGTSSMSVKSTKEAHSTRQDAFRVWNAGIIGWEG